MSAVMIGESGFGDQKKFRPTHVVGKKGLGLSRKQGLRLVEKTGEIVLFKNENDNDVILSEGQIATLRVTAIG